MSSYHPVDRGFEAELARRLEAIRKKLRAAPDAAPSNMTSTTKEDGEC